MLTVLITLGVIACARAGENAAFADAVFPDFAPGASLSGQYAVSCKANYTSILLEGELSFAKAKYAVRHQKPAPDLEQLQCQNSTFCNDAMYLLDLVECDNKASDPVWRCHVADNSSRTFSDPIISCEQDLDPAFRKNFCMLNGSCILRYTILGGLSTFTTLALVAGGIILVGLVGLIVVKYRGRSN